MDPSLRQRFAQFVAGTQAGELPGDVRSLTCQHVLDTLGCCLASARLGAGKPLAVHIASEGGIEQATAIGLERRVPASQAAFVNGLLARAHEFDDMAMPDMHPSGAVVAAALAAAEATHSSGAALASAVAIGLEIAIRLDRAAFDAKLQTSGYLERGLDASALCGTLAGAAVAARLFGLHAAGIGNAIAIAVSFASGSLEANRSGGDIKQFQSGWAAKSAIQAAQLARLGVTGPELALEGRYGFFQCFTGGAFDAEVLVGGLGQTWQLLEHLRFKPYPSNYYTHAGIDAALALRRGGLVADQVDSVQVVMAAAMMHTVGEPIERKQHPRTAYEAKFSVPYTFASALLGGAGLGLGLSDFTDALVVEPRRTALMERITVATDARYDAIFPRHAPAAAIVRTKDGRQLSEEVLVNRGSSERPLSQAEVLQKFEDNAGDDLPGNARDRLAAILLGLEQQPAVDQIAAFLKGVHV